MLGLFEQKITLNFTAVCFCSPGQNLSTMESTQSSARRPSRLTYKEASGMAATLSMLEDIGALHAALKISAENDKDQLL